jgi:hypothetical protein
MLNISMVGPLEVMLEIRECPPLMLKDVDGGPLGGAAGDPVAPTINEKNVDGRPPGPMGGVRSPSEIQKVCCKPAWV